MSISKRLRKFCLYLFGSLLVLILIAMWILPFKPKDSIRVAKKILPLFVGEINLNAGKFILIEKVTNKTRLISDGIRI